MNDRRAARQIRLTLSGPLRHRTTFLLGSVMAAVALSGSTIDTGARAVAAQNQNDAVEAARVAAARRASVKKMKIIMLGIYNHHDVNTRFPAAFSSKDGKPLLSWRVALLPYLESEEGKKLYEQFHLDEPWDSDHNKALIEKMPAVYQSPASELDDGGTVYLTPRGNATMFPGDEGVGIRTITDGTSKTIAMVEVDDAQAVPWTKPDDWKVDPVHAKVGFRGQYDNGMNTAFADGSTHFIAHAVDEKLLKALLTIQGREVVRLPN